MAVSSGFSQRNSKLSAEIFFDLLLYTVSDNEHKSLEQQAFLLQSNFGITIQKQSLHERFNSRCESFVKAVLASVLEEKFSEMYSEKFLPAFTRILIKDSTKFMTPRSLEDEYKSCGGSDNNRSKSSISIQYEYDLKSGRITDLNITSGNRNDRSDSQECADRIAKGDLILRDLGYFSTPVLKKHAEQKVFFLSRLDSSTNVYDMDLNQISFKSLYNSIKKEGVEEKDITVYIGKETRLPVRLILQSVPNHVYEQRIREKTKKSKGQGRGQLKEETKFRCRFNLFITNAESSELSKEQVYPFYRLRWQIELQFKIWKSVFKIDSYREMKKYRYLVLLYVKLLLIIVNLGVFYSLQKLLSRDQTKEISILSINKCMKTLRTLFDKIFTLLRGSSRKAKETEQYIRKTLSRNHWLESKNKKKCFPELLEIIIFISENNN